jgi:hypothetical protein
MTYSFLAFLTSIASIVVTFYSIDKENYKLFIEKFKASKRKKITITIFFLALVFCLVNDLYNFHENGEKDKEIVHSHKVIDSINKNSKSLKIQLTASSKRNDDAHDKFDSDLKVQGDHMTELLAKYGFEMDSLNNRIKNVHETPETPPTLTILNTPTIIGNDTAKELLYDLYALNADVHIIDGSTILLNLKNGYTFKEYVDSPTCLYGNDINCSSIIPYTGQYKMTMQLSRAIKVAQIKNDFILIFEYEYKSKGNKIQTPMRKAYTISRNWAIRESDNYTFGLACEYLVKHKIWKKCYANL